MLGKAPNLEQRRGLAVGQDPLADGGKFLRVRRQVNRALHIGVEILHHHVAHAHSQHGIRDAAEKRSPRTASRGVPAHSASSAVVEAFSVMVSRNSPIC